MYDIVQNWGSKAVRAALNKKLEDSFPSMTCGSDQLFESFLNSTKCNLFRFKFPDEYYCCRCIGTKDRARQKENLKEHHFWKQLFEYDRKLKSCKKAQVCTCLCKFIAVQGISLAMCDLTTLNIVSRAIFTLATQEKLHLDILMKTRNSLSHPKDTFCEEIDSEKSLEVVINAIEGLVELCDSHVKTELHLRAQSALHKWSLTKEEVKEYSRGDKIQKDTRGRVSFFYHCQHVCDNSDKWYNSLIFQTQLFRWKGNIFTSISLFGLDINLTKWTSNSKHVNRESFSFS